MLDVTSKDYVSDCSENRPEHFNNKDLMLFMLCFFFFSIFYSVLSPDGFLGSRNCLYWWECHLRTMISVTVLHRNRKNENVAFLLLL